MVLRWTQAKMREVAAEERCELGLGPLDPLDPYALARRHGIPVYPIDELPDDYCSKDAAAHFGQKARAWSAALVPFGSGRLILENTSHSLARRCSSVAHEMSHHLLQHQFSDVLLTDDGCRQVDSKNETEADFLAGELRPRTGDVAGRLPARRCRGGLPAAPGGSPRCLGAIAGECSRRPRSARVQR